MKRTVIIFGSNSQDGFYLNELLNREQFEIVNISRSSGNIIGTVGDFDFVENVIKDLKPDYIFHFAANSTTSHDGTLENNNSISTGTLNILEAVRKHCLKSKVFISGSALQFKNNGLPIDENTPFDYTSTYAISRIHSVSLSRFYREKFGVKAYVGYFFNHDSPLRSERHINQKIIRHLFNIKNGSKEKLIIGNLNVKKEFSFAGDIVEAIWLLVNQDNVYETVIGSGVAYAIKDWISYCFEKYSLNWMEHVIIDENYKTDYDILVSNPMKIKSLGWNPKTNMFQLANMMLQSEFDK